MNEAPLPEGITQTAELPNRDSELSMVPEHEKILSKHEKWKSRALAVGTVAAGGLALLLASPEALRHIEELRNAASSFDSIMVASVTAMVLGMGAALRAMAYGGWRKPNSEREAAEYEAWKKRVNFDERAQAVRYLGFET